MIVLVVVCRQVKWLAKGQDRLETLISISTDGNVLQWSLKKGLLVSLLMQLKRGGAVSA
jgi:dynein intermediate chain 4, axonemal